MGKGLERFRAQATDIAENAIEKAYCKTTFGKIISHMEEVCNGEYDGRLMRFDKSFGQLWAYLKRKARKYAVDGVAMVEDDEVYSWVDEYVMSEKVCEIKTGFDSVRKPSAESNREFTEAFNKLLEIFKERDEQFQSMLKLCEEMVKKEAM